MDKTILIVDDTPENLTVLYKLLRDDYKVIGASSGQEALRLMTATLPDLILLDVMMPQMSGFEVCANLKADASLKEIPVIFLTAMLEEADEARGFEAGAVDYITKPFKPSILKHRISTHLELKSQKDALRESDERHRAILQTAMDGIWLTDVQGRLLEVNETYCRMSGYSSEELLCMSIADLEINEAANEKSAQIARIMEQGEGRFESRHCRKDGSLFNVEVSTQYRPINGGQFVTFLHDITERKQAEKDRQLLERQFQHAQKMESLGILAGGIAHDFNNILAAINGYCGLSRLKPETMEENFIEIEKGVERAAGLCRQMLAYAGKSPSSQRVVDLSELVMGMVKMLQATIPQNVTILPEFSASVAPVKADASQIRQIVMNLIINATEAIDKAQGEISLSLADAVIREADVIRDHIGKNIPPGNYVILTVKDNGCGMDEETKLRLFDPFYSTKFYGRGLGMSAVLGILSTHKGSLQLTSQQGKGTTFEIYLPAEVSPPSVLNCNRRSQQTPGKGAARCFWLKMRKCF